MFNFFTKKNSKNKKNNLVPSQASVPVPTSAERANQEPVMIDNNQVIILQTPSAPFIENIEVLEVRNKMSQMDFLHEKERKK